MNDPSPDKWKSLPPGKYRTESHQLQADNLDKVLAGFRERGYQVDSVVGIGQDQHEVNIARRWDNKTMGKF